MRVGSWPGGDYQHNPFIANLCDALRARGIDVVDVSDPRRLRRADVDVLHLHWAEQIFWSGGRGHEKAIRAATIIAKLVLLRARGVVIVWTVHNLRPHALTTRAERLLWPIIRRAFCVLSNALVTLSPETEAVVAETYGVARRRVRSIRMPAYRAGPSHEQARARLGVDPDLILNTFFGELRRNKGVDDLLTAFRGAPDPRLRLRVLGAANDPQTYQRVAGDDPRVTLLLRYVEMNELECNVAACDAAVIPLAGQLHSSSLLHALSLGAPVVTRDGPFARGLRADVGPEWVRTYDGALRPEMFSLPRPAGAPDLALYAPNAVASELIGIYQEARGETDRRLHPSPGRVQSP